MPLCMNMQDWLSSLPSMASALLLLIFSIYWSQDLLCQLAGEVLVKDLSKSFLCCPDSRNLFWNRVAEAFGSHSFS